MENIILIIEEIIRLCEKHNYFNSPTLFVKTDKINNCIYFIAVSNSESPTLTINDNDIQYNVCSIKLIDCYSRILHKETSFAEIFNNTLCLKDELNISPTILSAIKPLIVSTSSHPETGISAYTNYCCNKKKELSIKFNGIKDVDYFIKNKLIPLSHPIKAYLSKAYIVFQNYRLNNTKSLAVTFFFQDKLPNNFLLDIQKYLYLHASELYLQNINIPFQREYSLLDGMEERIHNETMRALSLLSAFHFTEKSNPTPESTDVTTLIYLYIITAKAIFDQYDDFIKSNNEIYNFFLKNEHSDNLQFIINNHFHTSNLSKIENEFYSISISNIQILYSNYQPQLDNWELIVEEENTFHQYISQIYHIRSILKNDYNLFFEEYVKLMFACYDIPSYYKAYIPYTIKYLNHEI